LCINALWQRPRLRIASVQHEPEEPQESFDVDVVYTIKQEEMRDARMQESSTVGRNVPQVNIKYPQTITKFIFNIVSFFWSAERIFSSISW